MRSLKHALTVAMATATILSGITEVPSAAADPGAPPFFPQADWLWNPIAPDAAVADNSAAWIGYLSAKDTMHVANLYKYGVTLVPQSAVNTSTPRYDVALAKSWGADPLGSGPVPIPAGTEVPTGTDGQIAVLDPVSGQEFGLWQAAYDPTADTWTASWGGMTPLDGDGIARSGSATATAISRYAGVITADEFRAAVAAGTGLNHALVFSTDIAAPDYVAPAIKSDGANIAGVDVPMPEGSRVQLDPSVDVDAIPGITPGEKVIARTLQTHGAYAVDQGDSRMAFIFEAVPGASSANPATTWTDAGFDWDYYDMANIPWSRLKVLAP